MCENGEDANVPRLIDDLCPNHPTSLQNLCIRVIVKYERQVLYTDKVVPFAPQSFRQSLVGLPPHISVQLFQYLLKHSSVQLDDILSAFGQPRKIRIKECVIRNCNIFYPVLKSLCVNQSLHVIHLYNTPLLRCDENVSEFPQLCNEHVRSFQYSVRFPYGERRKNIKFHFLNRKTHPLLKDLRASYGTIFAWYFVIDASCPPALNVLELSGYLDTEQPQHVFQSAAESAHEMFEASSLIEHQTLTVEAERLQMVEADGGNAFLFHDAAFRKKDAIFTQPELSKRSITSTPSHDGDGNLEIEPSNPLLPRYRLNSMKDTLLSLTLHETHLGTDDFAVIFQLYRLQHLDISLTPNTSDRQRKQPGLTVWKLMEIFPDLTSLDVSSTEIGDWLYRDATAKPITGERSIKMPSKRKLDFLGLSETEGCEVKNIHDLATKVTGYDTELQMMTSIECYLDRAAVLTVSFNHLYALHRNQPVSCPHKLLRLLLEAVDRHPTAFSLLLTCTANFFFVTRHFFSSYSTQEKRAAVTTIVRCLDQNQDKNLVVRNCLLTLYHFDLPGDFIFCFDRVARVVLYTFKRHQDDSDINSIAVHLCNTLVCSLQHNMKEEVSKIDFVPTILDVIKKRLSNDTCDEVMEVCWSTLWNVTDETPRNSRDFIILGGLLVLQDCFEVFPDKVELHKNMMGLVGNIAEVKSLRPELMTPKLITLFRSLILNKQPDNNIEIAYNSCGTLSHIMSDGAEAWTMIEPSRDDVRRDMYDIVESWPLNSPRNINYRSFLPILRLLDCGVPESIHWAIWALCNLSQLDHRYSRLLLKEDGKEALSRVKFANIKPKTKELASTIVNRLIEYEESQASDRGSLHDEVF